MKTSSHPYFPKSFQLPSLPGFFAVLAISFLPFSGVMAEEAPETFDWIPAAAMSDGLRADMANGQIPEITVTTLPKVTADMSKYTEIYEIDLKKFGISNDGTHAVETSKGINEALQYAKTIKANRIVFPPGIYLISEEDPIVLDHKDAIIDLNGATLQMNSNGLMKYNIVQIVTGAENLRLTNGTLRGDRDTHDYSDGNLHAWGTTLYLYGGKGLEVDHLTLTNGTGDGVSSNVTGARDRPELLARIKHSVRRDDLESGGFTSEGVKTDDDGKIRTSEPYEMNDGEKMFEFGYLAGAHGFPYIKGRDYQVYFFDADGRFLEKQQCLQYRKVKMPEGTVSAHFEFNQSEVPEESLHSEIKAGGWIARINNFLPPTDVHFHDNVLLGNGRLGQAFCGGNRWVIENNRYENNGNPGADPSRGDKGANPRFGIDFEDGAELLYDVVFRKNSFKDNKAGDLVIAAGSELWFEDNDFEKTVVTWARPHNYIFRNNRFNGGSVIYRTRTGVAVIEGNHYKNCRLSVIFDTKGVADGLVRNEPGAPISTPALLLENETLENVKPVKGTYLNFKNSRFSETDFVAGKNTSLVSLIDCVFDYCSIEFKDKGPQVSLVLKGNEGDLKETGAIEKRTEDSRSES